VAASSTGTGGTAVNVAAALRGAITINSAQATQTGLMIKATPAAGSNATVTGYAVVANNQNNPSFNNPDANGGFTTTAAITNNQHLFVQVQAESGTLYYYRIVVTVSNNNANLATITIGQVAATLGTPQAAPWAGSDNTGTVIIPTREASPAATSVAFTSTSGATASWAKAADANAIPAAGDFKTGSVSGGLTKDQYLFVKAVSSDGTGTQYYKILISDVKSDVVDLASVAIGGTSIEDGFGAGGTGVNVGTNYRGGIAIPATDAVSGTRIKATTLAGSNATVTGYAVVANNQNNPTFVEPVNGEFTTTAAIANTNHLFVRVQAETGTVQYYRIIITIPALTGVTVGGTTTAALGTPQSAPWTGTANTGTIVIPPSATSPNSASIATAATPATATTGIPSAGVPVRTWAVAADANTIPPESAFNSASPIAGGLAIGNYIFVKLVSADGGVTLYYKILVSDVKNNVVALDSVVIGNTAAASIGAGGTAVNVAAASRGAITISNGQSGLVIKATPAAGSNATVTGYAVVANNQNTPTFVEPVNGEFTTTAVIANTNHLFVRVQAEIGTLYYYRIVITVG
jgi:hypothetical protein